jgi:hypothetical protein
MMPRIGLMVCGLVGCHVDGHYVAPDAAPDATDDAQPSSYWSVRYGGPGEDRSAWVSGIASTSNGDLVMAGTFRNTIDLGGATVTAVGGPDAWVARYREDGSRIWSVRFGGSENEDVYSVACDENGNTYVSGSFSGPVDFGGGSRTVSFGAFLIKLDSNGAYQWDRVIELGGRGRAWGITIPNTSTVVLTGEFAGTVDLGGGTITAMSATTDSFVAAYNTANGAHSWSRALARDPSKVNATSAGGDVVVVSSFRGTASLGGGALVATGASADVFLVRYRSSDGAHVWSRRYGGTNTETAHAIGSDGTNVYVGGRFFGTTNLGGAELTADGIYYDAFVSKYSAADGSHVWSRRFGGGAGHDETRSIAVSPTRVTAGISFNGEVNIGSQRLTAINATADMLTVRLDPATGSPLLASHFGSVASDDMLSIIYTGDRLAGVGTFQDSINAFGVRLTGNGGTDIAAFLVDY